LRISLKDLGVSVEIARCIQDIATGFYIVIYFAVSWRLNSRANRAVYLLVVVDRTPTPPYNMVVKQPTNKPYAIPSLVAGRHRCFATAHTKGSLDGCPVAAVVEIIPYGIHYILIVWWTPSVIISIE
jgi:hypothetical protein